MANLRVIAPIKPAGDFQVADASDIQAGSKRLDVVLSEAAAEVAKKANKSDVDTELSKKANKTDINAELDKKANKTDVASELATKADKAEVDTALAGKASTEALASTNEAVSANTTAIGVERSRVDQLVGEVPAGSGDEVADARVMANGTTATNLGTAIRSQVTDLKEDLSNTYYELKNIVSPGKNLYNPEMAQHNIHLNVDGTTNEVSGQVTSDYIYVIAGHNYWLNKAGNYTVVCWYDKEKNFISYNMHNASTAFTAPSGTVYARFGMYDLTDIQFEDGTGVTAYEPYYESLKYGKDDYTNADDIANIKSLITTGKNLYNKEKSEVGKHLNTNGITDEVGGYLTSEYIPVEPNTDYWLNRAGNYTVVCWYDDNKNCVGYGMHNASTAFTSASTAKYARLGLTTGATDVQFEKGVEVTDFEPYYNTFTYEKPNSSGESLRYVLDVNGNGDFTGWVQATTAIKDASNVTLIVKAGTYDIAAELGDEYLANYDVNVNGWGPVLGNGVHVIMEPNATLKFENTAKYSNVLTYFSPVNTGNGGYTLEGGSIICKNCRYAIHEDEYSRTRFSQVIIRGVYMRIDNTTDFPSAGTRCIGGGTGFCSNVIIEDCVFDTPVDDRNVPLVSFHTSAADNSKSQVVIKGNYFKNKGFLRLTWYGPSTLMSRFTVTNNNFGSAMPDLAAEDSSYPNNNIELIQWNNIVRS
ncbi:MAG: hypothetical protein MJ095_02260 [Oscillospiraceae bacterium]|nr:hypothetical protein [Oscillospiraceae bacterium]